ncbi:3-dehydroquinate synthase [Pontiella sulfatireligans]|uniref:3-dehydroquinate synthase n=1 Tax=Pontiella sulfatireligans TaxID=2750658 RepID=A0A6C2UMH0_9BACT|nr:3-dehydroquinate synthase [Pontiella sulfatireligans]VGO21472.1 3-dehydroquinate synthase [Pontiella sulfatireligans]
MLYDVPVNLGDRSYQIHIGAGVLDRLGALCAEAGLKGKCLVVTDENVGGHYAQTALESLETAGFTAGFATLPPGEQTKCGDQVFALYSECIKAGLDRKSFVVALGGGVIGDLSGFVASTYLRGIPFVQVPTSLLAMVDSSVGGKTGINIPEGKNLVGAFYQPELVLADLDTLKTLPAREYAAGLAEVVKYGIIYDAPFFQTLEENMDGLADVNNAELLAKMVGRSCEIKADVVAQDEREGGLRAILNFGHTAGHALEKVAGYGEYVHGEAVAVGSIFAARASAELTGLSQAECDRIEKMFKDLGLPVKAPGYNWADLRVALSVDKKTVGGMPKFVLVSEIGKSSLGNEIPEALMEQLWNEL